MKRFLSRIDALLLVSVLSISVAGLLTMSSYSVQDTYFAKQTTWIILSLITFLVASRIDFSFLKNTKTVTILYAFGLGILSLLFIVGSVVKGAKSWFSLFGFSFQPADLMKLIVIILLAKYFSRRHADIAQHRHVIVSFCYMFIPFILVVLQPDFGSAMVLLSIWLGMIIISGISKKHLIMLIGLGVVVFSLAWMFLFAPYQKARIITFIHPLADIRGSGYNAYQSTIAVGSGGLLGKGVGYGTQSRLEYLPEYRTDFIFAAFAEEWGFFGSILLLSLYFMIFARLLYFAYVGGSNFETLFTYGILIWFTTHVAVSIGMNVGLLPVTGIPLPFMSYGGSHLILEMLALGIAVSMYQRNQATHRNHIKNEFLGLE